MLTLRRAIDINRDAGAVFGLISDPARYPEFLVGITKWQLCSEKKRGLGASFRVLMRVGSIEAGGTVKVTDWQEPRTIAWRSERGVHQQGRWTVTPHEDGSTGLALEIGYDLGGGPVGWLVERVVGRIVAGNVHASLLTARRILTFDQASTGPLDVVSP